MKSFDLSLVPAKPGVYRWLDENGRVIYVGKAKNLRNRLGSYFGKDLHPRTQMMVSEAKDINWTIVENETEALNLEWTWIKVYNPRFNINFNFDNRSYVYLSITVNEEIPRLIRTREGRNKKMKNFGPYPKGWVVRLSLDLILKVWPVRTCRNGVLTQAMRLKRACLLYDIGKCSGPCVGAISKSDYQKLISDLSSFLSGHDKDLEKKLEAQMKLASLQENYELAAKTRDQLLAIRELQQVNSVVLAADENVDVIGISRDELETGVQIFYIRGGRILGENGFIIEDNLEISNEDIVQQILQHQYESEANYEPPKEIFISSFGKNNESNSEFPKQYLEQYLSGILGSKIKIRTPQKGDKKEILHRAESNAQEILRLHKIKRISNLESRTKALNELKEQVNLKNAPIRIEGYDISTTLQQNQVGSMVVFEDGISKKKYYRKFNVDTKDDTSALYEVIKRRFSGISENGKVAETEPEEINEKLVRNKFAYEPNLLLIDGGLPQVNAVQRALNDLGIQNIEVIGIAKTLEEIYKPFDENPTILSRNSQALFLLQQIRDESHRFAILAHRKKRGKSMKKSVLDSLPNVGKITRQKLLHKFKSVERIKQASIEELSQVDGISTKKAEEIKYYLGLV